jgi:hypothetical protein
MKNPKSRSHLRRVRVGITSGVMVVVAGLVLAACTGSSGGSQGAVNASNSTAQQEYNEFTAAVPYPYANAAPSNPLERENLAKRLKQYNSAGNTNYVYVFDFAGHVLGYYVITGKVSSTSSQMTSTTQVSNCGTAHSGDGGGCSVTEAIGDDGSYGPEEGGPFGVFFYTTTGTLVETDQPFLVSSAPISVYSSVPQLDAPASN